MTVPKSRRTKSKVEFFIEAYKVHDNIVKFFLKDCGMKTRTRDLKSFTYHAKMNPEDRESYINLCDKYKIDIEAEYPLWLIEYYRKWILDNLKELINNITQANSIYPTTEEEFSLRRSFQWKAIANCHQIKQAMQSIIRILPVNVEKFMPHVKEIEELLISLKNWKKSDNKILIAIKNKQKDN